VSAGPKRVIHKSNEYILNLRKNRIRERKKKRREKAVVAI
jgi:hypothetical protein